jgi:hypothetical protein
MAADFNMLFFVLFVLLFVALAITNMVAARTQQYAKPGQMYFGMLYLIGAMILIVYKMNNP